MEVLKKLILVLSNISFNLSREIVYINLAVKYFEKRDNIFQYFKMNYSIFKIKRHFFMKINFNKSTEKKINIFQTIFLNVVQMDGLKFAVKYFIRRYNILLYLKMNNSIFKTKIHFFAKINFNKINKQKILIIALLDGLSKGCTDGF